jgi:ElaB/YqjD/DUF883 family membrane-anchored ribosome-binding protein
MREIPEEIELMSMTDRSNEIANGARKTTDAIKSTIDEVVAQGGEKARHVFSQSKDRLNHALDAAGEGADKAQAFVTKQMHERPVTTVATALGAGVILGLLLSRRG